VARLLRKVQRVDRSRSMEMNSLKLEHIINKDNLLSKKFLGIFAADQMNFQVHKKPSCLVVNTDPSTKPGEHWTATFMKKNAKKYVCKVKGF